MRKKATPAEVIAWELLRDRKFLGLKFRRQHQVGGYVVDFYCHEKHLVLEFDGPVHEESTRRPMDLKRDAYLNSLGMTVLRIKNERLLHETEAVLKQIANAILPTPSGKEEDTSTTNLQSAKAKTEFLPSTPGKGSGVSATELQEQKGEIPKLPSPSGRGAGVRVNRFRDRRGEILFIDARKLGFMVDRTHRDFTPKDIAKIADTYHAWRGENSAGEYADVPGFCKSATLKEVRKHGHVLTPGRYVGVEPQEEDLEPFEDKMKRLTAQWREQQAEARKLDAAIKANLAALGFGDDKSRINRSEAMP